LTEMVKTLWLNSSKSILVTIASVNDSEINIEKDELNIQWKQNVSKITTHDAGGNATQDKATAIQFHSFYWQRNKPFDNQCFITSSKVIDWKKIYFYR
jgi:hypothetical protein